MDVKLKRIDPVGKQKERGPDSGSGLSPMDPPDAYAPPSVDPVAPAQMHRFLRQYVDEHASFLQQLTALEAAIASIQETGYTRESDARLRHFFNFFDEEFIPHHRREEAALFPLLHARLIEQGEHSKAEIPATAIDLMQDEHIKALQLAAVVLNFMGLAFRFPDERSRLVVLDAALEQAKMLVELLRLHIFREDNLVFALAHRLISAAEFDALQSKTVAARSA